MGQHQQFAPGMRLKIRDAEWRLTRLDHSSDGGYLLGCTGLSELVRGREAQLLSRLEDDIRILDPATTKLVNDLSQGYRAGLLNLATQLRDTAPTDERIHLSHHAAMDTLPFQLEPTRQALGQPRARILIARGRGKRILVLAVKSMLGQFQQEFWNRFTIPLTRLDFQGLARVRGRIPANHNPFHYFDRANISIDTLKQDIEYRHHLELAYRDIIIIDEPRRQALVEINVLVAQAQGMTLDELKTTYCVKLSVIHQYEADTGSTPVAASPSPPARASSASACPARPTGRNWTTISTTPSNPPSEPTLHKIIASPSAGKISRT